MFLTQSFSIAGMETVYHGSFTSSFNFFSRDLTNIAFRWIFVLNNTSFLYIAHTGENIADQASVKTAGLFVFYFSLRFRIP